MAVKMIRNGFSFPYFKSKKKFNQKYEISHFYISIKLRSFIINYFNKKKINKLVKPQFLCHYAFVFVGLFFLAFFNRFFTVIFI